VNNHDHIITLFPGECGKNFNPNAFKASNKGLMAKKLLSLKPVLRTLKSYKRAENGKNLFKDLPCTVMKC
jgi:hypothetical protein